MELKLKTMDFPNISGTHLSAFNMIYLALFVARGWKPPEMLVKLSNDLFGELKRDAERSELIPGCSGDPGAPVRGSPILNTAAQIQGDAASFPLR